MILCLLLNHQKVCNSTKLLQMLIKLINAFVETKVMFFNTATQWVTQLAPRYTFGQERVVYNWGSPLDHWIHFGGLLTKWEAVKTLLATMITKMIKCKPSMPKSIIHPSRDGTSTYGHGGAHMNNGFYARCMEATTTQYYPLFTTIS